MILVRKTVQFRSLFIFLAECVSRPASPTTHLQQVYILPVIIKKKRTMRRRFMESFREQKDFICATIGENKLEGFMTNDLEGRKYNNNPSTK